MKGLPEVHRNVLYFVLCGGYMGVDNCQLSSNGTLKTCACYWVFNHTSHFKNSKQKSRGRMFKAEGMMLRYALGYLRSKEESGSGQEDNSVICGLFPLLCIF